MRKLGCLSVPLLPHVRDTIFEYMCKPRKYQYWCSKSDVPRRVLRGHQVHENPKVRHERAERVDEVKSPNKIDEIMLMTPCQVEGGECLKNDKGNVAAESDDR